MDQFSSGADRVSNAADGLPDRGGRRDRRGTAGDTGHPNDYPVPGLDVQHWPVGEEPEGAVTTPGEKFIHGR